MGERRVYGKLFFNCITGLINGKTERSKKAVLTCITGLYMENGEVNRSCFDL